MKITSGWTASVATGSRIDNTLAILLLVDIQEVTKGKFWFYNQNINQTCPRLFPNCLKTHGRGPHLSQVCQKPLLTPQEPQYPRSRTGLYAGISQQHTHKVVMHTVLLVGNLIKKWSWKWDWRWIPCWLIWVGWHTGIQIGIGKRSCLLNLQTFGTKLQ